MTVVDLAYRLYERRLVAELADGPMPVHVGVILDGNRRFARERGLPGPTEGHLAGSRNIDVFLDWCLDLGISCVTLWLLSTDNLQRDDEEVAGLLGVIEETVQRMGSADERGLRVTAVGALELLPPETRQALERAEAATVHHDRLRVQVAVGYGGRQEITDALRSLLRARSEQGESLEEVAATLCPEDIGDHLYTTGLPDPDLIIRTSGEVRLSGFLLWQSAHSEFYFCDTYWPEFRRVDFLRALRDYQRRTRRSTSLQQVLGAAPVRRYSRSGHCHTNRVDATVRSQPTPGEPSGRSEPATGDRHAGRRASRPGTEDTDTTATPPTRAAFVISGGGAAEADPARAGSTP